MLRDRFETNQTLLLKHRGHGNANAGTPPTSCDANCRRRHVCSQMHANYDHYEVCAAGPQPPTTPSLTTRPIITRSTIMPPSTSATVKPPDQGVSRGVASTASLALVGGAIAM